AAAMLVPCSGAEDAKAYKITLHRPAQVGDITHEHIKLQTNRSMRMTGGDKPLEGKLLDEKKEERKAELSGVREALEVSPHGKVLKLKFTVEKFSVQTGTEAAQEPFKAGTILTA